MVRTRHACRIGAFRGWARHAGKSMARDIYCRPSPRHFGCAQPECRASTPLAKPEHRPQALWQKRVAVTGMRFWSSHFFELSWRLVCEVGFQSRPACREQFADGQLVAMRLLAERLRWQPRPKLSGDLWYGRTSIPVYEGAKAAAAPQLAAAIGLDVIRGKCSHFAAWLSLLEKLGEAGAG